jgi:hypothetical protein
MEQNPEQIFDPVRRKRVAVTPEEIVRQRLIMHLHEKCSVPYELMSCEYYFTINGNRFRSDLVVFGREGYPLLAAECKAPQIKIDGKVFGQILTYNHKLQVKYLLLTNGSSTFCAKYTGGENNYEFLDSIPQYDELSRL